MIFNSLGQLDGMLIWGCIIKPFQYTIVKDGAIYTATYKEYPNRGGAKFIGEEYYRFDDAVKACQWHVDHAKQ